MIESRILEKARWGYSVLVAERSGGGGLSLARLSVIGCACKYCHSRLDCGPTSAKRIYSHEPAADQRDAGDEYLVDAPAVEIDDLETPAESFDVFTG